MNYKEILKETGIEFLWLPIEFNKKEFLSLNALNFLMEQLVYVLMYQKNALIM